MVIKSDLICDLFSWFFKVGGITIWPFIIVREGTSERTIRHEKIHIAQYNETLVIGFLIIYLFEWLRNLLLFGNAREAYRNIRFEKEAYAHSRHIHYLSLRPRYAWWRY